MKRLTVILIMLALIITIPLQNGSSGLDPEPDDSGIVFERRTIASQVGEVLVDPGGDHLINVFPETNQIEPEPQERLSTSAEEALDEVPQWLRIDLEHKFRLLSRADQERYGDLIIDAPDERFKDEIAFCIAHSTPQTLTDENFFPELLTHNAELIYEHDQYLDYVRVVDKENYTTLAYLQEDGSEVEVDREIYYWYVVHPKLGDELPTYVDPDYDYTSDPPFDRNHGTAPPDGKFWRDWFFVYNKEGQPLLKESLSGKNTTLDAVKAINGWVSGSMQFTSDQERPVQPVRIYVKGIGRCGEYQDMRSSAARAALIPVVATSNTAEDHVWNEFWDNGWHHWDGTIDNPLMYENGWGKTISSVWNARGDGYTWPVTSRYSEGYSTLDISVIDSMWNPVDGATVDILTENFYQPDVKTTTISGTTDESGSLILEVGDSRNFWGRASTSDLGSDPPALMPAKEIVLGSEDGETYKVLFQLPRQVEELVDIPQEMPRAGYYSLVLDIQFQVLGNIVRGDSPVASGRFDKRNFSGGMDFFVTDDIGKTAYGSGLPFNSYSMQRRASGAEVRMNISMDSEWAVVFSNLYSQWTSKIISYNISIYAEYGIKIESPGKDEDISAGGYYEVIGKVITPESSPEVYIRLGEDGAWDEIEYIYWDSNENSTFFRFEHYLDMELMDLGHGSIYVQMITTDGIEIMAYREFMVVDVDPPFIYVDQEDPETREGESLYLSGFVRDYGGVDSFWYSYTSGGARIPIDILEDGRSWEKNIPTSNYDVGAHTLYLNAEDNSGNIMEHPVDFIIHKNDPPEIRITSPDEGDLVKKGDPVTVKGKVYSSMEIERFRASIGGSRDVDVLENLLRDGTFEFTLKTNIGSIEDGENTLSVWAVDEGGNLGSSERDLIIDAEGPVFDMGEGSYEMVHPSDRNLELEFLVTDTIGPVEIYMEMGGSGPLDVTRYLSDEQFQMKIDVDDLALGWNTISFTASDEAGWTSTMEIDCYLDGSSPEIKLVNEVYHVVIGEDLVLDLQFTEDDIVGLMTIEGNGISERIDLPGSSIKLELDTSSSRPGVKDITLTCFDRAGHMYEIDISINFIYENTDSDNDGTPDIWEYQNGFDPFIRDSFEDPDGDGFTNLEEYIGEYGESTDPRSSSSHPSRDNGSGVSGLWILLFVICLTIIALLIYFFVSRRK